MSEFRFNSTVEPKKLTDLFALCGSEWSGPLTAQEFGQSESKKLVNFILSGRVGRGFYLETKTGEVVAVCVVSHHKAFYKDISSSAGYTVPDPSAFGVGNITALRLSYVFTAKEHRGKGLSTRLVRKAIEYTEDEILKKELAKLDELKKDSFKLMVTSDGKVDRPLLNHYLRKKFMWYLYSAVGTYYGKFGFKGFALDGYRIPLSLAGSETQELVKKLVSPDAALHAVGKRIRFLEGSKQLDIDLIEFILQGRELELLTELSKLLYHSDLRGSQKSSLSLTNIASALSVQKLGSSNELSAISELLGSATISDQQGLRRKSSVKQFPMPKFALKPDMANLKKLYAAEAKRGEYGTPENAKYAGLRGAILTNELQQKSFYILWTVVMGAQFQIVGMGELKHDLFGAMADPYGFTNPVGRRRSSSFTGINEMGGFNFQDLDILVNAAVLVAKGRGSPEPGIYVSMNDLPSDIPAPVLHDFFLNYLPSHGNAVLVKGQEGAKHENTVEYIENFSNACQLFPMLRRFGSDNPAFDIDWVGSSMLTWG